MRKENHDQIHHTCAGRLTRLIPRSTHSFAMKTGARALIGALLVVTSACTSPVFVLGPPPKLFPPAQLTAPTPPAPVADSAPAAAEDVQVTIHKAREVPDLRGRIVALPRLAADALGTRIEHELTVAFIDRGVTRLLPGAALAEVAATLDRSDGGTGKAVVRLSSNLSTLSVVSKASSADFVLYGDAAALDGESTSDVKLSIPPEALAAYRDEHDKFQATASKALSSIGSECSQAMGAFDAEMAKYRADGGVPSQEGDESAMEAWQALQTYAAFSDGCRKLQSELAVRRDEPLTPEALQRDAARAAKTITSSWHEIAATIKLRDALTDETFWLGTFVARGASPEAAVRALALRAAGELTRSHPVRVAGGSGP